MAESMQATNAGYAAGENVTETLRLDGNAAAGLLSEIFVPDLTAAKATCAHCGATRPVGALFVYARAMGVVIRCPGCDAVVLCIGRTPSALWLDCSGARHIVIPSSTLAG
jgi:hypothetical protein